MVSFSGLLLTMVLACGNPATAPANMPLMTTLLLYFGTSQTVVVEGVAPARAPAQVVVPAGN